MAQVKDICKIDTSRLERRFIDIESKQLPFALAKSLTDIAKLAKAGIQGAMETKLDEPTPYTLNSLYVTPAKKTSLWSSIQFKDDISKGTPASRFLLPAIFGGVRKAKPFETMERRMGVLPGNMLIMPGLGVKLNRYGNVPLQQLEKILAASTGLKFNRNNAKRSKKTPSKPLELFVGRPGGGRLPLGIYQRTKDGILPLFVFATRASYKSKLPIGQIAGDIYEADFPALFDKVFTQAMLTAKP